MDIDEFLDKELGKSPQKKKATLSPEQFSGEVSTLITSIQYLLYNKQFDQIEETYDSLWKKIAENKFTWDVSLHQEINTIHDQLNKELGSVIADFYKKVQLIQNMMQNARNLLAKNQPEAALKVYNEVSEMAKNLPSILFEHKKTIERDVLRLYRDIHERLGQSTLQEVHTLSRQISTQAAKIRPYLLSGNIPLATEHYLKLLALYGTMPSGFLPLKVAMGKELIDMYKSLSIQVEIEDLRKQLHPLTQKHFGSREVSYQDSRSVLAQPQGAAAQQEMPTVASPLQKQQIAQQSALSGPAAAILARRKQAAKIHIQNKAYENALIELNAILRLAPYDEEAKAMLDVIQEKKKEMSYGL